MPDEKPKVKLKEKVILKKYDGDDQTKEPVETLVIEFEDGVEISRKTIKPGEEI